MPFPGWLIQAWPPIDRVIADAPAGRPGVALSRLADTAVMRPLLARFSLRYPRANRAAVTSQWSMNYMSIVLPATLACVLTLGRAIEVETDGTELLHEDGQPLALSLARPLAALPPDRRAAYWDRLIHAHFAPLFTTLSEVGGLATKVMWGNLVAIWDAAFARMDSDLVRDGFADAHRWLETAVVDGGRLHLRSLQHMVRSPAPDVFPCVGLRRYCCLHFQLHEPVKGQPLVLCETCPKLHRLPLAEQASYLRSIYPSR